MYSITVKRMRMASTKGGMRRILKHKGSVPNYIRQAVETGVYRSTDELEQVRRERRDSSDDLRTIMRRFRQNIVRGSNIQDYPIEYMILQQHPPIPDPPKIPKKLLRRMKEKPNPTEKLVDMYLRRQQNQQQKDNTYGSATDYTDYENDSGPQTTEEYYRRLLGVPAPDDDASETTSLVVGQKPAVLQKAYAAAIKHYELQRCHEGLTDEEAMARVDDLLAKEDTDERKRSNERAKRTRQFVESQQYGDKFKSPLLPSILEEIKIDRGYEADDDTDSEDSGESTTSPPVGDKDNDPLSNLQSIFGNNPRKLEGMMKWSERLQKVPYREWTVGASVAFDHWIARQLLGLSEETWQLLLEAGHTQYDNKLLSRGRDIIIIRETLFPETIIDRDMMVRSHEEKEEQDLDGEDGDLLASGAEDDTQHENDKTIEELLASIGGLKIDDDDDEAEDVGDDRKKKGSKGDTAWDWLGDNEDNIADTNELDSKIDQLVDELQNWRIKNAEQPFADWSTDEQKKFNDWIVQDYTATLMSSDTAPTSSKIDVDGTRDALLSVPPTSREDSGSFWDQLHDDTTAIDLLDRMRDDGPPPGATNVLHTAFWDLSYEDQLERLLNLGALRPLLDEYAKESDRTKFLQRYADTLMEGVELEHLVPDPDGPVRVSDLGSETAAALAEEFGADSRFKLELIPYKSSSDGTTSAQEMTRTLYLAWNQQKAGRARYEEKMFTTGRLGLRYSDKLPDEDALEEP